MLYQAHFFLRYLVLLAGLGVILHAGYGLLAKRPYSKVMGWVTAAFAGTLHLQLLLGVALLFTGRFQPVLIGHITMMVTAAAAAQVTASVMRRRPEESRGYLPYLVGTAIALVLIVLGILAIGRPIV